MVYVTCTNLDLLNQVMPKLRKNKSKKNPYRSGLEKTNGELLTKLGVKYKYESKEDKISYTVPKSEHTYLPDFIVTTRTGKQIIIETKGIWDFTDRYKHLLIKQQNPQLDIRFVFTRSSSKIKKGSKTTYADICNGKGRGIFKDVTWLFADKRIPKEWLEE